MKRWPCAISIFLTYTQQPYLADGYQANTYPDSQNLFTLGMAAVYPAGSWDIGFFNTQIGYGSPHGQDVAYVFEHLDTSNPEITKTDVAISEAMGTYWTNFAKRGDPNGSGVPTWPEFSESKPVVMHFSKTPHTGPVPSTDALEVLDEYFQWRRTPEGEAFVK